MNLGDKELHSFGAECVQIVQDNIRNKPVTRFGPMNASGRTAAAIRYEVKEDGLYVYGPKHVFVVETGRKPGRFPNIRAIRQWIDDKPIIPQGDISKDSLAFLIARSIANKGTLLHQIGGNSGILSEVINKERTDKLLSQLLFNFKTLVKSTLIDA